MKLLSAKNKKYAMIAVAIVGALFLAQALYQAYKAGAKTVGDYATALWDQLKSLISFNSVVVFISFAAAFALSHSVEGVTLAVAIGTLTTGAAVVTTINTTYLPEFFSYTAATQLTGVKITVQGEGPIFDSDANGLTHCGVNRLIGQNTNTYTFRIANGLITGKNIIWEFTNSAAQTPVIYVDSWEKAGAPNPRIGKPAARQMYLQLMRQAILANSGQDFSDFQTLSLPSIAAADTVTILYNDGTNQQYNRQDILAKLQYSQNVIATPIYTIDNLLGTITKVNVIAAAAQTAYVQRWAMADSGGMVNNSANN
jgi:hypothetical protein